MQNIQLTVSRRVPGSTSFLVQGIDTPLRVVKTRVGDEDKIFLANSETQEPLEGFYSTMFEAAKSLIENPLSKAAAPTKVPENTQDEALKAENEALKNKVAELEAEVASLKAKGRRRSTRKAPEEEAAF